LSQIIGDKYLLMRSYRNYVVEENDNTKSFIPTA
jgi:hypothetical protein